MATEKTCFIIMPITTPDFMLDKYHDGKEHFKHILDCLFIPSVEKAGYQAIPPIAKGADLIHAEVVHNLETADIVLCDMSCLNPNVFFEFGIRTSLNKPVCVVKDELTEDVPFDAAILNYHEYKSSLEPWYLEAEVEALSKHIVASAERSKNENAVWKYFGLKKVAVPSEGEGGMEAKLDYLITKVDSLSKPIGWLRPMRRLETGPQPQSGDIVCQIVKERLPPETKVEGIYEHLHGYTVTYSGSQLSDEEKLEISKEVRTICGNSIVLVRLGP